VQAMSACLSWNILLKEAIEVCRAAKEEPDLRAAVLANPELCNDWLCFDLLSRIEAAPESTQCLGLLKRCRRFSRLSAGCCYRQSLGLDRVPGLPVDDRVKVL
jgi:hypothetical protein